MSTRDQPPPATASRPKNGLDDPRAIEILTTEHWSLLSARTLGYQEMFGRTSLFVAVLSATVVALALLAQASHFSRDSLLFALLLIVVALMIGVATFLRSVAINYEDAQCVTGMNLLRKAYLQIVPDLEPFFVTGHGPQVDPTPLGHGSPQRLANLGRSLTTTSAVVAALNSVLAGSLGSGAGWFFGCGRTVDVVAGVLISLLSATAHVRYAARYRQKHPLPGDSPR